MKKIIELIAGWNPNDIAFIKSLNWSLNKVQLVVYSQSRSGRKIWPDTSETFDEIEIKFENASNFKLNFNGNKLQPLTGFDIIDVSENGMEGINFHIEDYEDARIEFYCENIDAEILKLGIMLV